MCSFTEIRVKGVKSWVGAGVFRVDFLQEEGLGSSPVDPICPSSSNVVGDWGKGEGNESMPGGGNSLNIFFPAEGAGNNFSAELRPQSHISSLNFKQPPALSLPI